MNPEVHGCVSNLRSAHSFTQFHTPLNARFSPTVRIAHCNCLNVVATPSIGALQIPSRGPVASSGTPRRGPRCPSAFRPAGRSAAARERTFVRDAAVFWRPWSNSKSVNLQNCLHLTPHRHHTALSARGWRTTMLTAHWHTLAPRGRSPKTKTHTFACTGACTSSSSRDSAVTCSTRQPIGWWLTHLTLLRSASAAGRLL